MPRVTNHVGRDLGDITNENLLAYYRREGYTVAGDEPEREPVPEQLHEQPEPPHPDPSETPSPRSTE